MEVNFRHSEPELNGFFSDQFKKGIYRPQENTQLFANIAKAQPIYRSQLHALLANRHLINKGAFRNFGLNAPAVQMVSMTIGELVELLKTTPTNNPHYMTLVKIAENEGILEPQALNGFFSSIGNFVSRNVSSAIRDTSRIVGQVIKVAAPIVSGVTGIPIASIAGVVGKLGDMIGGDIGNGFSALANNGQSTQAANEQFVRDQNNANAQAQAEYDKAQAAANAQAQAAYNAEQAKLRAQREPRYMTPNMTLPFTPAQVNTLAQIKNVAPEVVQEEIQNVKVANREAAKEGFKFTTPIIIGGIAGVAVLGVAIYAIAKK